MILTSEVRDSLLTDVRESELAQSAKDRITNLLQMEDVPVSALDEIRDLIQAEIDADDAHIPGLAEALANDPELRAADEKAATEMAEIEAELADSVRFIEEESAKLEQAAAELDEAASQMRLEQLKGKLGGTAA